MVASSRLRKVCWRHNRLWRNAKGSKMLERNAGKSWKETITSYHFPFFGLMSDLGLYKVAIRAWHFWGCSIQNNPSFNVWQPEMGFLGCLPNRLHTLAAAYLKLPKSSDERGVVDLCAHTTIWFMSKMSRFLRKRGVKVLRAIENGLNFAASIRQKRHVSAERDYKRIWERKNERRKSYGRISYPKVKDLLLRHELIKVEDCS